MEDSSSSSSDSSSMRKGDRVVMCSVANREPVLRSRECKSHPFRMEGTVKVTNQIRTLGELRLCVVRVSITLPSVYYGYY